MNVEFGTEAAQFPEKEFINGIFLAVVDTVECTPRPQQAGVKIPSSLNAREGLGISNLCVLFVCGVEAMLTCE
jgi:hypothetical protein